MGWREPQSGLDGQMQTLVPVLRACRVWGWHFALIRLTHFFKYFELLHNERKTQRFYVYKGVNTQ